MNVTVLVENNALEGRKDLSAEHGLSLHIEHNGKQILFDTGVSDAFSRNAQKLGVDVRAVDMVVISHHHFDHGGGLAHFLETNTRAKVYLKRHDAGNCYFKAFGILEKYIGLDTSLFEKYADRFEFVDRFTEISPEIFILTEIGKPYPVPKGNRYLFVKQGNTYTLDDFKHELMMVVREKEGLVVFTGCSHSGILNMIDTVTKQFEGLPIKAVFGGFHMIGLPILNLMAGSKAEVEGIGRKLLTYPIEKAYTGHCTGDKAYRIFKGVMGKKLEYLPTGSSVEV